MGLIVGGAALSPQLTLYATLTTLLAVCALYIWHEIRTAPLVGEDGHTPDDLDTWLAQTPLPPVADVYHFADLVRSMPLDEALCLLPDGLAGEVEAWLEGGAA